MVTNHQQVALAAQPGNPGPGGYNGAEEVEVGDHAFVLPPGDKFGDQPQNSDLDSTLVKDLDRPKERGIALAFGQVGTEPGDRSGSGDLLEVFEAKVEFMVARHKGIKAQQPVGEVHRVFQGALKVKEVHQRGPLHGIPIVDQQDLGPGVALLVQVAVQPVQAKILGLAVQTGDGTVAAMDIGRHDDQHFPFCPRFNLHQSLYPWLPQR